MASPRAVIGESESDPLYPPTIVPPRAPLGLLRFAVAFVRNPLTVLPEAVYEQPVYRYGKMLTWVTDPPLIKKILLDEYENFPKTPVERRVLAPLLGNGMLVSGGPEWKWQRQTTAPVFRQVEVLRYTPAMNTAAEDTIAEWRKAQPGTVQPIDANMSDASYAVISDTMLAGADGQAFDRADLGNVRYSWPFAYALLGLPTWLWYPNRGRKERSEKRMREAVLRLVQSRRANPGPRDDVLVHLLRAKDPESGQPMSDTQLVDVLLTLLVAGHETTAKALAWTLYLIARSPEWEARMLEEVRSVAGGGPILAEHIDKLKVTTMVLKEVHAALFAGADAHAHRQDGHGPRRPQSDGRQHDLHPDLRHPSPQAAVGRSGPLRPRAFRARPRQRLLALPVFPVRRRPAHLRRRLVRDGGVNRHAGGLRSCRAL